MPVNKPWRKLAKSVALMFCAALVGCGGSSGSSPAPAPTPAPTTVPDTVPPSATSLSATPVSATQINLVVTGGSDAESGFKEYVIDRSLNGTSAWSEIYRGATSTHSDTGLTASTRYFYRARARDNAGNYSTAYSSANASTTGTSTGSGVFFQPNLESATSILDIFDARNGTPAATISTDFARPGKTKSVKITYNHDEDGDDLIVMGSELGGKFIATPTLFTRSYERLEGPWPTHWPQGLKTARYFTTPDLSTTGPLPGNYSYTSEKLIFPGYETSPDPRTRDYVTSGSWAYLDRPEISAIYGPTQIFGNGLPYIRTGHWYKWERWMVQNSAPDVADGILRVWIDDVLVLNITNMNYKSNVAGVPNGDRWKSMWFGGNHSNSVEGTLLPQGPVYRYLSDFYLSTTLDR